MSVLYCEICGNEIPHFSKKCPFCGSSQENDLLHNKSQAKKPFINVVKNLEQGLPTVEVAMRKLDVAIADAQQQQVTALTLIHGYGSSGKGGVIREECRKILDYMRGQKEIKDYIFGENFNRRSGSARDLIRRYPELGSDRNLGKTNKGITIVIL